jgi:energy-coupling factor transporter ATP-binding protein EcfA2
MFEIEDIAVEGDIGILGENRSGKSTILDLLQIILTGASPVFYRLNSPAGDNGGARSKSQRTVRGYCLGQIGETEYKRETSLTYVSMSFVDPDGDKPPVTIGLALEASQNESSEVLLGRFVATGAVLRTDDYLVTRDGSSFPMEWDDFRSGMVDRIGDGFINHRDRALDFVREYMRRLVPGASAGEKHASAMLKALVNAMTLPTGLSATQFVRNFIVPDQPIRIAELRNSIETYRGVDNAIADMKARLAELKVIREHIIAYRTHATREELEGLTAKRARFLHASARYREVRAEVETVQERLRLRTDDADEINERLAEIDAIINDTQVRMAARKAKSGLGDKEKLAASLGERIVELGKQVRRLLQLSKATEPIAGLPGLDPALSDVVRRLARAAGRIETGGEPADLAAAEVELVANAEHLAATVERHRSQIAGEAALARKRLDELQALLGPDANNRPVDGHLEPPTRQLMLALRQDNMAPRPLCDLIEIADPAWSGAIEGLLGRDREIILVDRADISRATALFKSRRRDFRGASLVSLNKIPDTGDQARTGYLPSLIRTDDRDAMLFILRRYGTVRLADDMASFEADGRALMQDGLYDDGLARTHRAVEPRDFKIGRTAQAMLIQNRRAELEELQDSAAKSIATGKILDGVAAALSELRQEGARFGEIFELLTQAIGQEKSNRAEIEAIIAQGDDGLGERLRENRALKDRTLEEKRKLESELADDAGKVRAAQQLLDGLQNMPGSRTYLSLQTRFYRDHRSAKRLPAIFGRQDYRGRLHAVLERQAGPERNSHSHWAIAEEAAAELERASRLRTEANDMARRALRDYFGKWTSAQVGAESTLLTEILPWMDMNIDDIENNALREREREAAEAAARARSLFRSEFINELTSRISNMDWELRALNASMANHPFHNERYSFHKTQDAIYGPILRVIDIAKTSDDALDLLFADEIPADSEFAETIAEVTRLLEDPDIDFSSFEDYRKFYTFDLHMEDIDTGRRERWESRRQTGSGAEQQVPLYVAIAASLASVYGHRPSSTVRGMALAMFDEAFTKLDGKNQRQMISFLKSLGLQIVIVAPPEKRSVITGYIDTVVEVDRIDSDATTEVVHLKPAVRAAVDAINPENLTDDDIRTLSAAE